MRAMTVSVKVVRKPQSLLCLPTKMRLQLNLIPHLPNENTLATNNLQIQKRKRLQERTDVLRSVTFVVDDSAVLENALAMVQNGTEGTPRKFQVLLLKMASLFDRVLQERS